MTDHDQLHPLHRQKPLHASETPYDEATLAQLRADAEAIIARYPQKRSALIPMLHLVQSVDGFVTGRGVQLCAQMLDISTAEVAGVATFYTQFKRKPNGDYTVGVCTNTLCAMMGGDAIFDEIADYLGVGHDETTGDGKITLERVECNAACDYAPVVMVNWEFFDNQTPDTAREVVSKLQSGEPVAPSRGPHRVCSFKQMERVLAGFPDGLANEGTGAGEASLRGLKLAQERGWTAPQPGEQQEESSQGEAPAGSGAPQGADAPPTDKGKVTSGAPTTESPEDGKPADSPTATATAAKDQSPTEKAGE